MTRSRGRRQRAVTVKDDSEVGLFATETAAVTSVMARVRACSSGGDPLEAVVWLAANLGTRDKTTLADQPVMTGATVQSRFLKAGDRLEFAMDGSRRSF
ncbi:MAG: hypothetical protein LCH56_06270 [Proteobacteria bacterium]|nr:hypothetical protein [Pseudomonadota bacterium]